MTTLLLVAGATASGKSSLGLALAEAMGGEILNIDSVQIYRGLDIGSAKPSLKDRSRVPHHLIDFVDPNQSFSVAEFLRAAESAISDMSSRGVLPVAVGGTGMYIRCLLHGLADLPPGDPEFRAELESLDTSDLYDRLRAQDSNAASLLHSHDRVRIVRALEIRRDSERPVSAPRETHAHATRSHPALIVVPCWGRDALYKRIDDRSAEMVRRGLVGEVTALVDRFGMSPRALHTIGYAETLRYLKGKMTESMLIDAIAQSTRRFAKRQMTFWRNEPRKRGWLVRPDSDEMGDCLPEDLSTFVKPSRIKSFRVLDLSFEGLLRRASEQLRQGISTSEVWFVNGEKVL